MVLSGNLMIIKIFSLCLITMSLISLPGAAYSLTPEERDNEMQALKKLYVRPTDIPYPADNPYSDAKAALGKILFFDPRLSASGTQSCATCHNPGLHWEDGMALGTGHGHKKLERGTPSVANLAWDELFFLDGRAEGLEAQAKMPIESMSEMGMTEEKIVEFLNKTEGYKPLFEKAFPGEEITEDNLAKAIATFERGIVSNKAPFDLWIEGDETAITESAKRGFLLFNKKANCAACHSGWRFSDGSFHDIGLSDADMGRGKFLPQIIFMQKAFKTMGLRNIAERAPYMHNGSLNTLEEVVDYYDNGFIERDSLSEEIKPLNLTAEEKADLVEFLKSLSSEDDPVTIPKLPK